MEQISVWSSFWCWFVVADYFATLSNHHPCLPRKSSFMSRQGNFVSVIVIMIIMKSLVEASAFNDCHQGTQIPQTQTEQSSRFINAKLETISALKCSPKSKWKIILFDSKHYLPKLYLGTSLCLVTKSFLRLLKRGALSTIPSAKELLQIICTAKVTLSIPRLRERT